MRPTRAVTVGRDGSARGSAREGGLSVAPSRPTSVSNAGGRHRVHETDPPPGAAGHGPAACDASGRVLVCPGMPASATACRPGAGHGHGTARSRHGGGSARIRDGERAAGARSRAALRRCATAIAGRARADGRARPQALPRPRQWVRGCRRPTAEPTDRPAPCARRARYLHRLLERAPEVATGSAAANVSQQGPRAVPRRNAIGNDSRTGSDRRATAYLPGGSGTVSLSWTMARQSGPRPDRKGARGPVKPKRVGRPAAPSAWSAWRRCIRGEGWPVAVFELEP